MKKRLSNLHVGEKGVILIIDSPKDITSAATSAKRRILDMGLTPHSEIEVIRVAPLGDPIEFKVKGYIISLRKAEADLITVLVD